MQGLYTIFRLGLQYLVVIYPMLIHISVNNLWSVVPITHSQTGNDLTLSSPHSKFCVYKFHNNFYYYDYYLHIPIWHLVAQRTSYFL